MATLKYISGTLGDKHEGFFTENRAPDQSSLARNTDYLVMENIYFMGNSITITRVNNTGEANKDLKKLKPILGLGLRDAFRKAAANTKNHSARLDRDIASLTQLEASELTNASGAAILSIAGIALMGPLGALAGLAAQKKGETVFILEFKETVEDQELRGQTMVASCTTQLFNKMKKISKAPSRTVLEQSEKAIDPAKKEGTQSLSEEIEKLKKMKELGVITEEEYQAGKAKILDM